MLKETLEKWSTEKFATVRNIGSKSEIRLTDRKVLDSQKNVSRLDKGSQIKKYVIVRKMSPY